MNRTGRNSIAWLALVGIVGAGSLLPGQSAGGFAKTGLDPLGGATVFALPPPGLSHLCPILEDPVVTWSTLTEPAALALDDGYRLPLASRAPPAQA